MAGILDFLQAASNEAAGAVSAPVDGIAWLLRKAGVPVNAPVGGSDWMEQRGLTRPVKQSATQVAGATAGLLSPVVAVAKAPQIAKGLLQAGENLATPSTIPRLGERGMILYHGTQSNKPITEILGDIGIADGLFTSPMSGTALSHGDALYRVTIPDSAIHGPGSMWSAIEGAGEAGQKAYNKIASKYGEELANYAVAGTSPRNADGDLLWQLQKIRGHLSKDLGYKAVGSFDEHGTSYLVNAGVGVKPRPSNELARAIVRGNSQELLSAKELQAQALARNAEAWRKEQELLAANKKADVLSKIESLPSDARERAKALFLMPSRNRKESAEFETLLRQK